LPISGKKINMALTKEQKKKAIDDLKKKVADLKSAVFIDFSKVNSQDLFAFRKELKAAGCNVKVSKKTLLGLAFGEKYAAIWEQAKVNIPGQLAVVFGVTDEIAPSRISVQFGKKAEALKVLGGIFEEKYIDKAKVLELASLPSRSELLSRLVGSLSSSMTKFVRVLDKIRESKEAPAVAAAAPAPAPQA